MFSTWPKVYSGRLGAPRGDSHQAALIGLPPLMAALMAAAAPATVLMAATARAAALARRL